MRKQFALRAHLAMQQASCLAVSPPCAVLTERKSTARGESGQGDAFNHFQSPREVQLAKDRL